MMSAGSEFIAGLDLGTTKSCCVVAKVDPDGEATMAGVALCPSMGVRRGLVTDLDAAAAAIADVVSAASKHADVSISSVYVGVSGEQVQSMNSRGVAAITHADQEITPEDRARVLEQSQVIIIPNERRILHAIPRVFSVDGQRGIRKPVGMCGSRLEVETLIITGSRNSLLNLDKAVRTAKLDCAQQVLASLASGVAVLSQEEREQGVCLLDIGGGTTDIAAFSEEEILHASVLPVGGTNVTNDIAQVLRVAIQDAESLKVDHGHAVPAAVDVKDAVAVSRIGGTEPRPFRRTALCEIIHARMEELFLLVKKDLDKAGVYNALTRGIVLTGGGSLLAGTAECASQVLGLPARVARPSGIGSLSASRQVLSADGRQSGPPIEDDSPIYATAVGLMRWGVLQEYSENEKVNPNPAIALWDWIKGFGSRR
ncbi:MAG: cell division protein FtsA [Chthonomonadales bacterium]|nr:cell division protein FtsA [Chthonomonadales bacterium]